MCSSGEPGSVEERASRLFRRILVRPPSAAELLLLVKFVAAQPGVPVGQYTAQMLEKAAADPAYGSDFPKHGSHSVGVAPQWCGNTGKKENCQAGVFLGYASRKGATLLDRRLSARVLV